MRNHRVTRPTLIATWLFLSVLVGLMWGKNATGPRVDSHARIMDSPVRVQSAFEDTRKADRGVPEFERRAQQSIRSRGQVRPTNDLAMNKVPTTRSNEPAENTIETATFGAGCFWCVEAVFQQLKGVVSVESGYAGGSVPNPTYQQICTGLTGHAEVCQIRFDPKQIEFTDLLKVFWQTHDPTTLNRQGPDVGTQYRSVIFYHDEQQKTLAEKYKRQLNDEGAFKSPIVTEISPLPEFYKAEKYHQNYYRSNPYQGYCRAIIRPKLRKFRKDFADKLTDK